MDQDGSLARTKLGARNTKASTLPNLRTGFVETPQEDFISKDLELWETQLMKGMVAK